MATLTKQKAEALGREAEQKIIDFFANEKLADGEGAPSLTISIGDEDGTSIPVQSTDNPTLQMFLRPMFLSAMLTVDIAKIDVADDQDEIVENSDSAIRRLRKEIADKGLEAAAECAVRTFQQSMETESDEPVGERFVGSIEDGFAQFYAAFCDAPAPGSIGVTIESEYES